MSSYNTFAYFYDSLTHDVEYKKRTAYLLSLFKRYDKKPTLLLDVACGTGGFSLEFAKAGIEVIGVDSSENMLSMARQKAMDKNLDILFLCQYAQNLDLYGTVDGAVCCLDSLNHITDYHTLCRVIAKVSLFLEKGRLFIFDVNTEYKQREILGNNIFVDQNEQVYCVWQNRYDEKHKITDISLDFFEKVSEDKYVRSHEDIKERVYTHDQLGSALSKAGFKLEACFKEMTDLPVDHKTQRAVYVARKE